MAIAPFPSLHLRDLEVSVPIQSLNKLLERGVIISICAILLISLIKLTTLVVKLPFFLLGVVNLDQIVIIISIKDGVTTCRSVIIFLNLFWVALGGLGLGRERLGLRGWGGGDPRRLLIVLRGWMYWLRRSLV